MAGSSSDEDDAGRESRSKLLKRHKAELLKAHKEGQRLGKKRAEEAAALVAEVTARHVAELAAFDAGAAATSQQQPRQQLADDSAQLAVTEALEKTTISAEVDGGDAAAPVVKVRVACVCWPAARACVLVCPLLRAWPDGCASRRRPRRKNAGRKSQKRRCAHAAILPVIPGVLAPTQLLDLTCL